MLRHLIFTYQFNLARARTLVRDLPDEQMVRQPHGLVNHPAWLLGHLAASSNQLAKMLGLESTFPAAWTEAFKSGGVPSGDAADFPPKEELLAELAAQHERVAEAIASADPAHLRPGASERGRPQALPDRRRLRGLPDLVARGEPPGTDHGLAEGPWGSVRPPASEPAASCHAAFMEGRKPPETVWRPVEDPGPVSPALRA